MFKSLKTNPIIILFTIFVIIGQTLLFAEDTVQDTTSKRSEKDSTQQSFPEKRRAREPWEYIVSAPVWIAMSPLWLLYKGTAAVIGFVDDHDIPEKVERVLISEDGSREIMPDYSSRTGGGVYFLKKGLISQSSELKISGSYWLLHRHSVELEFTNVEFVKGAFYTDIDFLYEFVPDEPFYGIGPETPESAESNYTHREIEGSLAIGKKMYSLIDVSLRASLGQYKITEGKDDEFPSIDSIYHSKALLAGLQVGFAVDTRDKKGHPTRGTLFRLSGGFYDEIRKGDFHDNTRNEIFGFSQLSTEIMQHMHLPWSTGRVLVLRAALDTKKELEDKHIPLYLLSELGSDGTIRGFYRGRYRDKDAMLASLEYRYPIWCDHPNSLDAVLFVDAGQVSEDIMDKFRRKNMRYGFGGGLRFYNDENDDLMARVSFGFSKDEFRVIFALNE